MRRLWPLGLGLVVWQMVSVGFGAGEFAYDLQPPLLAMLAAALTVVGWMALGAWAGHYGIRAYLWFAAGFWLLMLAMLVLVKIALVAESDSVSGPGDAIVAGVEVRAGRRSPTHSHAAPRAEDGGRLASYL